MDLLEALTQIGFTEYEAKVYLGLLEEHPVTGYQVSKRTGVPRSMVYETLSRLSARGVVLETIEGRATLYTPLPPAVLLDRHEQEHERLIGELRAGLERLYTATREDHVWTISGEQTVLAYARHLISAAAQEVYLVLGDDHLLALREVIADTCRRGVAVSTVLTGTHRLDCGQVVYHPPLESELQGLIGTLLVVADNRETLIASTGADAAATITRNSNLVLIARQFVWMELFTQRIYARLGADLLARLDPQDRRIFESLSS